MHISRNQTLICLHLFTDVFRKDVSLLFRINKQVICTENIAILFPYNGIVPGIVEDHRGTSKNLLFIYIRKL